MLQSKTGTTITQYLYSAGTGPLAQYTSGAWQYLVPDALGSVRQIADVNGNVTLAESYEPYGSVLASTPLGGAQAAGTASSIFGYMGEQFDVATGLVFAGALHAACVGHSLGPIAWDA